MIVHCIIHNTCSSMQSYCEIYNNIIINFVLQCHSLAENNTNVHSNLPTKERTKSGNFLYKTHC